jgi:hypothetical protein
MFSSFFFFVFSFLYRKKRWFVIHDNKNQPPTVEIIQSELEYVFQSIMKVKKNESSWNYLRGLVNFHPEITEQVLAR